MAQSIPKNPKMAWFADLSDEIPKHLRTLIFFIYTEAKITIVQARRSPMINITLVKHKISWTMINEKLTSILRDKQTKFEKVRNPWIKYLQAP